MGTESDIFYFLDVNQYEIILKNKGTVTLGVLL